MGTEGDERGPAATARRGRGEARGRRRRSPVFVDRPEVRETLGLASNATLARYVERGACPPPDRWLTPTRPVWLRKEWDRWLSRRAPTPIGRGGGGLIRPRYPPSPAIQSSAADSSSAR